ncbi:MAG: hypothetical protein RH942_03855 [Kiloniellaceae bacterium]
MPSPTVAEYLAHQIRVCDKTQKQIAEEIGYQRPNIITMMKLGQTKVPLEKVPAIAKALGADPAHLLGIVLREYYPENWKVLREVLGFVVTQNERELIEVVRETTMHSDPRMDAECQQEIGKLIKSSVRRRL